jgi:hypothetical protein
MPLMDGGRYLKGKIALIIVGLLSGSISAFGQIDSALELSILDAYNAIDKADRNGGNVSKLVDSLNLVIDASQSGLINTQEAMSTSDLIIDEAERIEQQGIEEQNLEFGIVMLNSIVVIGLCYVVWKYFPRLYWYMWLKFRGHWIVE